MMKRYIFSTIVAVSVILPTTAQVNSLQSCIDKGLENNYSLKITRNEEAVASNNATIANAGYLPQVDLSAGYSGTLNNTNSTTRATGAVSKERNVTDHTLRAGVDLSWTIFDGFNIQAKYSRLQELKRQSKTQTRIVIED